tara:strand:- start:102 stop:896 length:795 start_codon:yes stop_codon:yes gene_type:complete
MKRAVLSYSGGMDSTGLLLSLTYQGYHVTAISFDYGQKHKLELKKAAECIEYLRKISIVDDIAHHIIELKGLTPLLDSHLVTGGNTVPEGHYEDKNMKQTVVPNRNKIMASIIQSVALSLANKYESEVKIAMGIHSGDHAIYPDCRKEFRDADFEAFQVGNWDSYRVKVYTPFLTMDKYEILARSLAICEDWEIDFDEVFKRTNTSYKPVGEYSDYKSASSIERIEAFLKLGRPDPVPYADETGLVSWEKVKDHALTVLQEGAN